MRFDKSLARHLQNTPTKLLNRNEPKRRSLYDSAWDNIQKVIATQKHRVSGQAGMTLFGQSLWDDLVLPINT